MQVLEYNGCEYLVPDSLVTEFKAIDKDIAFLVLRYDRQFSPEKTWRYSDAYLDHLTNLAHALGRIRIENLLEGSKDSTILIKALLGVLEEPVKDSGVERVRNRVDISDIPDLTESDFDEGPDMSDIELPVIDFDELERYAETNCECKPKCRVVSSDRRQGMIDEIRKHFAPMPPVEDWTGEQVWWR